jgi:hypothetical protein
MKKAKPTEMYVKIDLPGNTTLELRGRQSVRATFRLTEECIDAISIVSNHLGIKQKSLFDHLVEDAGILSTIAGELGNRRIHRENRVQKTFVLSRRSLESLESAAQTFNAPRDALVEYSVQRLLPVILREREQHEKRKQAFHDILSHFEQGKKLLSRLSGSVGREDPFCETYQGAINAYETSIRQMGALIRQGKVIEEFDPKEMIALWRG